MLVISRDIHESFILLLPTGEKIAVTKLEHGRIGIDAPKEVLILREELTQTRELTDF